MDDFEELRRLRGLLEDHGDGNNRMALRIWSKYGGGDSCADDTFIVSVLLDEVEQALRDASAYRAIVRAGREIFQKDS